MSFTIPMGAKSRCTAESKQSANEEQGMEKDRMSLMTFNIASDLACGAMEIMDVLRLAKEASIPFVDLMNINPADIPDYPPWAKRV